MIYVNLINKVISDLTRKLMYVASELIPSKVPVVLRRISGTCIDILSKMSNSKGHIQSATKFPFNEEILMHEVCMTESTQYQWEQAIGVLTAVEQKGSNW